MASSQTPPTKRADDHESTAINDDVLYEILLRLPAKPLCRLRAVCRSWRSLLSAPSFIAAHTARQAAPLLVVRWHDGSALNVEVRDILSGEILKRIRAETQSSTTPPRPLNPFVLAWMRTPHDLPLVHLGTDDDGLPLRVLDLVTGTDFALPDVDHDAHQRFAMFMFGRASTGEYKVLCISTKLTTTFVPDEQQLCSVLTLSASGDHQWRDTACPPSRVMMGRRRGAAVNGVAYYLLTSIHDEHRPQGSNEGIVAYDLEKEAWRPASLPIPVPSNGQLPINTLHFLAELSGCLALVLDDGRAFMELWLLVDPVKVTWSKRYTITVPDASQTVQYFREPLWLLDDGRIIILRSLRGQKVPKWVLCTYDPRTMAYTDVADIRKYGLGGLYTGSLLGPGSFHLIHQGGLGQL